MSELLLTILSNSVNVTGLIFLMNYTILPKIKVGLPDIIIVTIALTLVSILSGFLSNMIIAKRNCNNYNPRNAIKQGFIQALYALIGYYMVYFIGFVREPFLTIFGNGKLGYSIGQSFIIVLNIIIAVIISYFSTIKASCQISNEVLEKKLKKLDKYLDEKPVEKKKSYIEVKD